MIDPCLCIYLLVGNPEYIFFRMKPNLRDPPSNCTGADKADASVQIETSKHTLEFLRAQVVRQSECVSAYSGRLSSNKAFYRVAAELC